MIRNRLMHLTLAALAAYGALGCESGGVGDPCIPEDEYKQDFNGYALTEVNVESRSFQCETRVCIVNHFQGRVSCPYGQEDPTGGSLAPDDRARCRIPGTNGLTCTDASGNLADCNGSNNADEITVPVDPQLIYRNAQDTVYCSCRCKGPDKNARYCECPSGFVCEELVREIGVPGREQLVGSYCIKPGTKYDPTHPPPAYYCDITADPKSDPDPANDKNRTVGSTCGQNADGETSNPPI